MKKILIIALSLVLLAVYLACGPQNGDEKGIIPSLSSDISPAVNEETETDPPENPLTADLTQEFKDQRTEYKFRFKWGGMHSSNGYEYLLRDVDRCMVFSKYFVDEDFDNTADRDNVNLENIKNSKDIITEMVPYKVKSLLERAMPLETVAEATYEAGETITVDGCEATRFTGDLMYTLSETNLKECTVVGYAIMGSQRPMLIWATDISEDHEYIEELTDLVDRIILTFEDEPEGEKD
ncbi:MAG: hypothetical protein LBK75_02575 [Oscillospiraceae bacterium]|nr:hypothetical protein [Oscillospiraceae bacterium]